LIILLVIESERAGCRAEELFGATFEEDLEVPVYFLTDVGAGLLLA